MKILTVILSAFFALPLAAQTDGMKEAVVRKLEHQRVTLHFDRVPLEDVVDYFREATGLNFVLDRSLEHSPDISIHLVKIRLKSALRLMLGNHGLTAVYREGALFILPLEKVTRQVNTKVYDVRALLLKIRDFPGPKMELAVNTCGLKPIHHDVDLDPPSPRIACNFLMETVKANTGGRSWEENGATSMDLKNGFLVVTQSKRVHAEIQGMLNLLRRTR